MSERLPATPGQTVGPFFHFGLMYDRSHELVPPATTGAVRLHGHVYDGDGEGLRDAMIEIRQADADGAFPQREGSIRRDGMTFTGWGRAATDPGGHYAFTTVEPGTGGELRAPFISVVVFARGLLNRLFTRIYLPGPATEADAFLASLDPVQRQSLIAVREDDGSLRFDIHLQGERETTFLAFPGHGPR